MRRMLAGKVSKADYERRLPGLRDRLLDAQFELRKNQTGALAVIVTGLPSAGRSELVARLLEWLDPKYVTVCAFNAADRYERQRPLLWRYWQKLPARGRITVLFAGWYQELVQDVVKASGNARPERRAVERILHLEKMLQQDGVQVVKVHLHVDEETQHERLQKLSADKLTRWRVTDEDRWNARHYSKVTKSFDACIRLTDHAAAPWQVVDGSDYEFTVLTVGGLVAERMERALRPQRRKAVLARREPVSRRRALPSGHDRPAIGEAGYERELGLLQGRVARLVRRRRFDRHSLVLAFEGMDAAGKGGVIRRIIHALDVRHYTVVPVCAPSPEELRYPYLWRFWKSVPPRDHITIFDRSWYGRVLVERVRGLTAAHDWQRAYDEINEFELQLAEHRAIVHKFWLSVGYQEQLARFKARDENPLKRFKVDSEDWANRRHFAEYQHAAHDMLRRTNTGHAPWTIVEADDKRYARLKVLRTVCGALEERLD